MDKPKVLPPLNPSAFKWVFLELRKPACGSLIWSIASNITLITVGIFSKFLVKVFNKTTVHNQDKFIEILSKKPTGVPLLTVSNHHSCFDDPGIWGTLNFGTLCSRDKMRWSLAAHDICFTNIFHSYFFMLGKCIPVIRGLGVHQEAVDFMIERLHKGDWVHIFPEGRVNVEKEFIRFKWGVGRMIYESPVTPIVVPIWHLGMDEILPNKTPYIFRMGKAMTLNYGKPIDLSHILLQLRTSDTPERIARKVITDKIQEELMTLKKETEKLHNICC